MWLWSFGAWLTSNLVFSRILPLLPSPPLVPSVMLIHDPKNPGAHEDWSRLARLSFDGPEEEMELSRHAIELLDMVDEVRIGVQLISIKFYL